MNKEAFKLAVCVLLGCLAIPALLSFLFSGASDIEGTFKAIAIIMAIIVALVVLTLYAKIWIICDEIHEYLERKEEEEEEEDC